MKSIINDKILTSGYENMGIKKYTDSLDTLPLFVKHSDLPKTEVSGIEVARMYNERGELVSAFSNGDTHALILGTTGGGKTTSVGIPQCKSFARRKTPVSFIISDPKGEILRECKADLDERGYKTLVLSFRDANHTEYWNPLTPLYDAYHNAYKVYKEVDTVQTLRGAKNRFRGKIYEYQDELDADLSLAFGIKMQEACDQIDDFVTRTISIESEKDPIWEMGARELLKAFIHAMLEDSVTTGKTKKKGSITRDNFSFRTMFQIYSTFDAYDDYQCDHGYFKNRDSSSKAKELSNPILRCARNTRASYMTVFMTKLACYKNSTVQIITSCNSFDYKELVGKKPIAVFINYKDEIKTQYALISAFVKSVYDYLTDYATQQVSGKLEKPFYFLLDEFGNFPAITDFDTAITAARGRNIYFVCLIQSYAQLTNVYGDGVSQIIRDNMNVKIFFGSNNPETLEKFKEECGEYTRISPLSALAGQNAEITEYNMETIHTIPKSTLCSLSPGECVVIELNKPYVFLSRLERYYMCPELKPSVQTPIIEYHSSINPFEKKYTYKMPPIKHSDDDDE